MTFCKGKAVPARSRRDRDASAIVHLMELKKRVEALRELVSVDTKNIWLPMAEKAVARYELTRCDQDLFYARRELETAEFFSAKKVGS